MNMYGNEGAKQKKLLPTFSIFISKRRKQCPMIGIRQPVMETLLGARA